MEASKPKCAHCRRAFTPTRKRKLTCGAVACRLKHADRGWNAWKPDRSNWTDGKSRFEP